MNSSFHLRIRESIATPEKKLAYNQDLFTRVAWEYDTATWAMSLGRDRSWKRRLVATLPELTAPRCVDLACGTGDVALLLAEKYPRGEIIGIDLTPSMLEVARARAKGDKLRFVCQDMCLLDFADESVDVVTGSYAIRNAPELGKALAEISRVLVPGGWAGFLDFRKTQRRLLQALQLPMLRWWGGFWGMVVHGRPEHAYIAESLRQFPTAEELPSMLGQYGLCVIQRQTVMLGMLEILVIQKAKKREQG